MKKVISVLLILMVFFGGTFNSFSAKKFERETIDIKDGTTGKEYTVKVVNILMGGNDVISDVPAMLFNDRTLVPVRFISENLGAEVSWNQETKEATVKTSKKEIVLKIDSPIVTVNGKEYTLPDSVPAKLVGYEGNYRTMVPLRFVSEQLGMEVGWIGETMTATIDRPLQSVKGISYDNSGKFPEIAVKTSGEVETSSFFLQGSEVGGQDRLVVDIANSKFDIEDKSLLDSNGLLNIEVNDNGVKSIRASQFEVDPYKTRIVIDMDIKKGYDIFYDEENSEVIVRFVNSVKDIRIDNIYNVDTVVIKTLEEPAYNIMFLEGKVVVDVLNSLHRYEGGPIEVNKGGIKRVRHSQFQPDQNYEPDDKISRVVVDLEENVSPEDIYIEHVENEIFVYVAGKPLDGFDYHKEEINTAKLTIKTDEEGKYSTSYSSSNDRLTIKVLKNKIDLDGVKIDIEDNIIDYIKIDDKKSSKYYYIYVKLTEGTKYADNSRDDVTDEILFSFVNDKIVESKYRDSLIVIDPGHGGVDPGAISPRLKLKEKNVVLEVSLKLKKLLENQGFKVYMTRDDDNYIGLYDRATIANELGADIFVSIHANAHTKTDVEGVQVLYYPDDGSRDNKTFAKIMRDALCKELSATDRGIIQRPKLVVIRETKMPAVLLELGFLTNKIEEELLSTKEYRDKCAEAAYKGIIEYFDNIILK